jgi:ABC-2 type transport system permease protein
MNGPLDSTVLWLTWRQLFARRRLYLAAAFSLAPLLITLIYRLTASDVEESSVRFLTTLLKDIVIGTLLPLAALVFGTTAFGGEIDDGTLVYLLVKPLARWRIVLTKYLVATACTFAVMIPAVVLPWLILRSPDLTSTVAVAFLAGAGAGALVYCAIFVTLGLMTRRALVIGLLYVIGLEVVWSRIIAGLRSFSVREFAVAITRTVGSKAVEITDPVVQMTTVWTMGTLLLVVAVALAVRALARYEVAERL